MRVRAESALCDKIVALARLRVISDVEFKGPTFGVFAMRFSSLSPFPTSACFALMLCVSMSVGLSGVAATPKKVDSELPDFRKLPALKPLAEPVTPDEPTIYIAEYRVIGAKILPTDQVGDAVYPFLGPERTLADVEQARSALEKLYKDKGYQTVAVEVPPQRPKHGIVVLKVIENSVGQLRVNGARWFLPSHIKKAVPSLAPGTVPNFEEVQKDIIALNQLADRRVTPSLAAGLEPGTIDVDLTVEDTFPLHGSIELNNRYNPNTTPLRLNGSVTYNNLWQWGHTLGASMQIAPERQEDALVYSAFYLARFPGSPWSIMASGTKQDSDVSTLGGAAVAGRGEIYGIRFLRTLPAGKGFFHSMSFGFDYKKFDEDVVVGADTFSTPIKYWPVTASYSASWMGEKRFTEFNAAANFHFRGAGSEPYEFDNKRYNSFGSYLYLRGDLSHTQDLPGGFQAYGKLQGQAATDPLINSEQYAGGGLSTVRGYLESEALGDNGYFGTFELRSPNFLGMFNKPDQNRMEPKNEWRIYAFVDGGRLTILDPLPDQQEAYKLASYGAGSVLRLFGHLNGSIDLSLPLYNVGTTLADDLFVSFRVWAEF